MPPWPGNHFSAFSSMILTFHLDSTYEWHHRAPVFLYWLILLSIMPSRSIRVVTKGRISFFSWLSNMPVYIYYIIIFICMYMYIYMFMYIRGFPVTQWWRSHLQLQKLQETWVQSLGWEDLLEEETATHSSILACRIPRTEEPGGLRQSTGLQRDRHYWSNLSHPHTHTHTHIYIYIYSTIDTLSIHSVMDT